MAEETPEPDAAELLAARRSRALRGLEIERLSGLEDIKGQQSRNGSYAKQGGDKDPLPAICTDHWSPQSEISAQGEVPCSATGVCPPQVINTEPLDVNPQATFSDQPDQSASEAAHGSVDKAFATDSKEQCASAEQSTSARCSFEPSHPQESHAESLPPEDRLCGSWDATSTDVFPKDSSVSPQALGSDCSPGPAQTPDTSICPGSPETSYKGEDSSPPSTTTPANPVPTSHPAVRFHPTRNRLALSLLIINA